MSNSQQNSAAVSDMKKVTDHIYKKCDQNDVFLKSVINKIKDSPDPIDERFLKFIAQYVEWNSAFPGCVAYLVSVIHLSEHFRKGFNKYDSSNADIASFIFAAAEDEYGYEGNRITHRSMAIDFLASMEFALLSTVAPYSNDRDPQAYLDRVRSTYDYSKIGQFIKKIKTGYGIYDNSFSDGIPIVKIFNHIGFHMGSEMLATTEFTLIDDIFNTRMSVVKEFMAKDPGIGGQMVYTWVDIHREVETEHFQMCLEGAKLALAYVREHYPDLNDVDLGQSIIDGFNEFADLQESFFIQA